MEIYREETDWFHVYANAPGVHGRAMATVASVELGKHYVLELYGIPLDSWEANYFSEDGSQANIWVSRYSEELTLEGEEPATYFTIERISLVKGLLKPEGLVGGV
jgi:hypothetical protein